MGTFETKSDVAVLARLAADFVTLTATAAMAAKEFLEDALQAAENGIISVKLHQAAEGAAKAVVEAAEAAWLAAIEAAKKAAESTPPPTSRPERKNEN